MRFFHLINVRWYNATAWYALNLCRLLQANGFDTIAGVLPNTETARKAKEMGIKTYEDDFTTNSPFKIFALTRRINRFLREFKPDFITAHRGEIFWLFALKRYFSKPAWRLIRVRGDERKPKDNFANRFLHNVCADRVIVSCDLLKREFVNRLQTPEDQIDVIYGGVDTRKFAFDRSGRDRARSEFGFNKNDIVIGFVGRYSEVKGHKTLIEAARSLRQSDPRYKLLFVTDSADLDIADLQTMIDENGLTNHAFITGFRSDIVACISAFDVGVVASIGSEAICRVAFEIMSVGVPLIASNVGATPEIAPSGNITPPSDPRTLAEKIKNHDKNVRVFSDEAFLAAYLAACDKARI
ncbi:MAG: glycosyltransferase [Helicobacteraceae bacterium]|jgi:glycosyltransferase involved in cell wall biosynthesis|nr:glycosyltransferase [Helicobacteraceae bacterium]